MLKRCAVFGWTLHAKIGGEEIEYFTNLQRFEPNIVLKWWSFVAVYVHYVHVLQYVRMCVCVFTCSTTRGVSVRSQVITA